MAPRHARIIALLLLLALLALGCAGTAAPTATPTPVPCDGTPLPFETLAQGKWGDCLPGGGGPLCPPRTVVEAITQAARLTTVLDAVMVIDQLGDATSTPLPPVDLSRQTVLLAIERRPVVAAHPVRVVSICQRANGLTLVVMGEDNVAPGPTTVPTAALPVETHPYHILVVDNDALLLHGRTPVRLERTDGFLLYEGYVDLPEK